ncbi:non-ribosomal peptide synthetase [Streptomyces virginiae]|uniref:non-ribosomal peptide synthetase n=1 Tax=Streptomyces virginiae TaxID=1961 RepID=UPI003674C111
MSENSGLPTDQFGPAYHGAVHRVPAGVDPQQCRSNLAGAVDARPDLIGGGLPALWCEPVAGPSGSSLADRRRTGELDTPIGQGGRSAVRLTLLEYTDGKCDLVLVADAARIDRSGLDAIATAVLHGVAPSPPSSVRPVVLTPVVDQSTDFTFALPEVKSGPNAARDVAATLELVLARTLADERVTLDVTTADGRFGWTLPVWDEDRSVAEFRASAGERFAPTRPRPTETPADTSAFELRVALQVDLHEPPADQLCYKPPIGEFALTLYAEPADDGGLTGRGWCRPDLFPRWRATALGRQLTQMSRELMTACQQQPLTAVELLDEPERERVLALGRTERTWGSAARTLPELIAARTAAAPDAIALTDGDTLLSYRRLTDRASQLSHALRALGVAPCDRVGVCLERSADLVVVLLAVLTAGATYVPLDPAYPADRLAFMAEDAELGLVLVDAGNAGRTFASGVAVPLDRLEQLAEGASTTPPASGIGPDDGAYIIYTSGSTGRPKGVVVPHRNVAALLDATAGDLGLGSTDTWTWFHSAAFDFSVWEIWGALITGGRLVVVPYWTCRSPEDFRELLVRERVSVLNHTPSAFSRLLELERGDALLGDIRLVIFGGEPLDTRSLTSWFDAHPETRCRVVNMFGITETTVHVTAQTVTRADALAATRSVGRAIPGWAVRVLDSRGRLLPPGSTGEIAVAGDGLALHYLHRPELTAQRFVTDPQDGTRLYLSGDKGRLLSDGRLEHLGRLDSQVKLRGHRIELDEIRNVLLGHDAVVAAAVVLSRPEGDEDAARLDAYVVLDGADPAEIRQHAAKTLPDYMVPGMVIQIPELPLTVNGKVDVKRLPAPAEPVAATPAGTPDTAPAENTLAVVLAAWRTVLHDRCAAEDDFFDLGGNSLLALRISHALRDAGVPVSVRDIYRWRTAVLLAQHADNQM